VPVSAEREEGASSLEVGQGMHGVATDESGRYALKGLRPGTYTVRAGRVDMPFSAFDGGASDGKGAAVRGGVQLADGAVASVDLELTRNGTLVGTVRDADGKPVPQATVFVRLANGRLLSALSGLTTDADGSFTDFVPAGSVTLSARTDRLACADGPRVDVHVDEVTTVDLVVTPGAHLEIVAVDASGATLGSEVAVRDGNGHEVSGLRGPEWMMEVMSTASASRHELGPLPLGTYEVTVRTRDGRSKTKTVALSAAETVVVEIRTDE
jgi:hypothetical protein